MSRDSPRCANTLVASSWILQTLSPACCRQTPVVHNVLWIFMQQRQTFFFFFFALSQHKHYLTPNSSLVSFSFVYSLIVILSLPIFPEVPERMHVVHVASLIILYMPWKSMALCIFHFMNLYHVSACQMPRTEKKNKGKQCNINFRIPHKTKGFASNLFRLSGKINMQVVKLILHCWHEGGPAAPSPPPQPHPWFHNIGHFLPFAQNTPSVSPPCKIDYLGQKRKKKKKRGSADQWNSR